MRATGCGSHFTRPDRHLEAKRSHGQSEDSISASLTTPILQARLALPDESKST